MKIETIVLWILGIGFAVFVIRCSCVDAGFFNPPIEIRKCSYGLLSDDIDIINTSDTTLICRAYIGRRSTRYFKIGPYENYNLWIDKATKVRVDVEGFPVDLVLTLDRDAGKYSWEFKKD